MTKTITIFAPGTTIMTGEILSQDEAGITLRYKKPRSSKYAEQLFPAANILGVVSGDEGEGNAEVILREARAEVYSLTGETSTDDEGRVVVTNEDGYSVTLMPGVDAEIIGDASDEEPKKAGKGAKAAAAKGGKAKKEEAEEEEAPAKGKKGGKAKAAEEEEEEVEEAPKTKKGGKDKAGKDKGEKGGKAKKEDDGDW